ncbi:MAG TPA: hypothetical protein PKM25_01030, partial [Candidatus Ozemobacteraceae bacterium]|nr:hypothetical protein [Candidatus Ozemobacteraceae bacterium]
MKISNFPTAQELFKQLEDLSKDDQRPAEAGTTTPAALPVSDSFEKAVPTADQAESGNLQQESGGLRIAYHFDLFYQLSQQIQTKMGQSGQERFVETSSKVAEAFKGNFSLQIDGVGSFLKGTDSSLKISNETTNQFLDSVNNLADLSPEALSSFLEKSDTFFNELEKQYGESGGAFDEIKAQMQEQARNFFDGVKTIQDESGLGAEFFGGDSTGTEAEGTGQTAAAAQLPQSSETDSGAPDVTLAVGPQQGTQVSANQYQAFVESFLQYTLRFKQSIFSTMLSSGQSSPQSALSSTVPSSSSDAVKSTQATMLDKLSQALHPDTPNGKFPTGYFPASDNA